MKTKSKFSEKLRYAFENTLSSGTPALIGWLGILSIIIVMIGSVVIAFVGISPEDQGKLSFFEAIWQSAMRAIDAGTVAGDMGWSYRFIMLFVTIGGIFIVSALIGILTSGLEQTIEELRKGRSKVIESNHTLILGWSSKIYTIITELIVANENQRKPRIVIMADRDKIEMEDELKAKIPDRKNTKIICRTGSSLDLDDLKVVNPHGARSIIVLAPEDIDPDIFVIKSVLAITNNPNRKKGSYHIVAEIEKDESMEAARLVGGDEAVYVQSSDLIARVTAQTCRQSGLSVVYTELLDFDGDEIYFSQEDALNGKTYKDSLFIYDNSAVMGIMDSKGDVAINPPMDTIINKGDSLIVISEDDDTMIPSNISDFKIQRDAFSEVTPEKLKKEKTLILGWNEKGQTIIRELENYVGKGSEVFVMAEMQDILEELEDLKKTLNNQQLNFKIGNTTLLSTLEELNIPQYDYIIILCYKEMYIQEADAKTLVTLLHLRNLVKQSEKHINIISEMLDIKNRDLAEVTKADDFIVSDKLTSLMLSQLSENKNLKKVFDHLFRSEGSEVYLRPVTDYVKPGIKMNFYTVVEAASRRNETAVGYRIVSKAFNVEEQYGVVVNPVKSEEIVFDTDDKIIVFAED
ncbi:MAG: NAD-binding protein [Bacteroidales bacterium]|nr:NAD-binding protein [Bacteroidales bacterium]